MLALFRQAKALGISRGSLYYRPRPVSGADLALMRRIDELHQSLDQRTPDEVYFNQPMPIPAAA